MRRWKFTPEASSCSLPVHDALTSPHALPDIYVEVSPFAPSKRPSCGADETSCYGVAMLTVSTCLIHCFTTYRAEYRGRKEHGAAVTS